MAQVVGFNNFEIFPLNKKEAYSFKSGGNQLTFVIDESDIRMLDPTSLRLNYTLRLTTGTSVLNTAPSAAGEGRPNPQIDEGGNGVLNGVIGVGGGAASVLAVSAAQTSSKVGSQSVISDVTIRSNNNNAIIEQNRFYSRLASSLIPYTLSQNDYGSFSQIAFGAFNASDYAGQLANASDISTSTNLLTGLTSQRGLWNLKVMGGARIIITLNSDQTCIFGTEASANGGYFYELHDVSLTGVYKVLSQPVPPNPAPISYNNYQCFTTILTSSDDTTNLNLSLGEVLAVWNNSMPSVFNNNYLYDGCASYPIMKSTGGAGTLGAALTDVCEIKDSIITRSSVKFPNDYQIDERVQVSQKAIPVAAGSAGYNPIDTLRFWNFANGVKSWDRMDKSIMNLNSLGCGTSSGSTLDPVVELGVAFQPTTGYIPRAKGSTQAITASANSLYGWGTRMDIADAGQGIDYANASYSQRILSTNTTGTDPNIVYSFALCKNTLVPTPGGPVVRV